MKKIVLITGIKGGIGKACAEVFSDAGYTVLGRHSNMLRRSRARRRFRRLFFGAARRRADSERHRHSKVNQLRFASYARSGRRKNNIYQLCCRCDTHTVSIALQRFQGSYNRHDKSCQTGNRAIRHSTLLHRTGRH